jgi:predicted RNase H-like nuclease (RuvC/YqgF family)
MIKKSDPTINELRKIFTDAGLEFYIKKEKGGVVRAHFIVREEENAKT